MQKSEEVRDKKNPGVGKPPKSKMFTIWQSLLPLPFTPSPQALPGRSLCSLASFAWLLAQMLKHSWSCILSAPVGSLISCYLGLKSILFDLQ